MSNKRFRVCHVTSAHQSNDMRIFQKECRSLAQNDQFDVYLVAQGKSRKEDNVKVIGVGENKRGRLYRMINISNRVCKTAAKLNADIYHLHDPELLLYALKLKKKDNVVIFDSHENYPKQIKEKKYLLAFLRNIISALYKIYETHVVRKIDAVIIPGTTNGKNPFQERAKNTILLDNYPILDDRRKFVEHNNLELSNTLKVCYAGGLSADRGITKLIKACYLSNARLILAGNFSSEEYKREVMNMKEAICVDYRGYCDYDTITKIYEEADIGAATLLKVGQYATMENLPTKTYEYMQVGLPILMTNTKYNVELMKKENFAYLVEPDNVVDMANMIQYIANNYSEAIEKTKLAYRLIQEKYNWNLDCKKLIDLYNNLLKAINNI